MTFFIVTEVVGFLSEYFLVRFSPEILSAGRVSGGNRRCFCYLESKPAPMTLTCNWQMVVVLSNLEPLLVCSPPMLWMLEYLLCTHSPGENIRKSRCWSFFSSTSTWPVWEEQPISFIQRIITECLLNAGHGSRRWGFNTKRNRFLPSCTLHVNEWNILASSWNLLSSTIIIWESGLMFTECSQDSRREVKHFLCHPSFIPSLSIHWALVI